MLNRQVVTQGVVLPNGSLQLDPVVELPVGPVEVFVRARPAVKPDGSKEFTWFEYLLNAREALEKQGVPLMTPEEAEAHIAELRADRDSQDPIPGAE